MNVLHLSLERLGLVLPKVVVIKSDNESSYIGLALWLAFFDLVFFISVLEAKLLIDDNFANINTF